MTAYPRRIAESSSTQRLDRWDWRIACAIVVGFSILYAMSIGTGKRNLEWFNFIMDADPGRVLGDALRGQNPDVLMRHPLFTLTIAGIARVLQVVVDPRVSVLGTVALLSACAVGGVFLFFRVTRLPKNRALLFAVLYGLAISTWILSSIPETFAISSGMILLIVALHRPEFAQPRRHPWRFAVNAMVGALAVGIAVPNIVYVALGVASNLRDAQPTTRRRLQVFAAYCAASLSAFIVLGMVQRAMFPERIGNIQVVGAPVVAAINDPFLRFDRDVRAGDVARLIRAFTVDNVIAPTGIVEVVHGPDGAQEMIQYGGRTSSAYVVALIALIAVVVALVVTGVPRRVLADHRAQLALAIIAYNIAFHFFYRGNGQPFIFSVHTVFALILLLALIHETSTWRLREAALAAVVGLTVLSNVQFVGFVNFALDQQCATAAGNVCVAWAGAVDSARFSRGVPEFLRSADYPFEQGRTALANGQADRSIALFRRALAIDSGHIAAQVYLGAALIQTNHADQAIPVLTTALTRDPSNLDARRLLAVARQRSDGG